MAAIMLAAALPAAAQSPPSPGSPSPVESRQAVERIVREYLRAHPEIVVEALRAYEDRQQAAEQARAAARLEARHEELLSDPAAPVGGNPTGDVTIVEFFDYRCSYCRRAAPTLKQLIGEDGGIRVVYKELPILGPESVLAARAALAARSQGKYVALHDALMKADVPFTRAALMQIAAGVGLDISRLERDMESAAVADAIQRNVDLARAIEVNGTPAFVVGRELVPGAVDLDTLKGLVERARAPR